MEIIYDGDCGLCKACIAWVERHDRHQAMVVVPSATLTAEDVAGLPAHRTVTVRADDGSTLFGSQAVAITLGALPGAWGSVGRVATRLLAVAPFRAVGDTAYNAVANHRSQISAFMVRHRLLDSSCQVPRP